LRRPSRPRDANKVGKSTGMIKNAIVLKHDRFAARTDRCEPRPEHSPSCSGRLIFSFANIRSFDMIRWCSEIMDACDVDPFCSQPETRVEARPDFFIWIRCNPLKSPDSAKEEQGNASFFPWFSLDCLGGTSSLGCGRDRPTRSGPTPAATSAAPAHREPGRRRRGFGPPWRRSRRPRSSPFRPLPRRSARARQCRGV
jgi:hypothetical protein